MKGGDGVMLIYHVDVNSAYLSWTAAALLEKGYGKDIRDIPSAIAGDPENRHGIILAKSIPAKKYGITTAESLMEARQKCPELAVYPPDYDHFLMCSNAMYDILSEYTDRIERYSVDECFLDCTYTKVCREKPVETAYEIKERIKHELGFTVNIGIGPNKLLAKMAGELKKPDMVHTIWMDEVKKKMWPLPAGELFMVGRASERKLKNLGIYTIGQLAQADENILHAMMKSHGNLIHAYANGIDLSPVTMNDEIIQKGVGNSMTFSYDLTSQEEIHQEALALCERVGMRLRKLKRRASLVSVHLRSNEFFRKSHQIQLQSFICTTDEIYQVAVELIDEVWKGNPIRQMGISVSGFAPADQVQMTIFDNRNKAILEELDAAVDRIRLRFGNESIIRGTFANTGIKPIEGGVNDGNYLMMGGYKL